MCGQGNPEDLVYGEVGRFPIQINASVRCIRYWLKLTRMEGAKAEKLTGWLMFVKLCAKEFSYLWDNQGMGCLSAFIRELRQWLIDIWWQTWEDHVNTSDRYSLYRQFKTLAGVEPYMMLNLNRYIRYTLTTFRVGVSDIRVHRSRFKVYNVDGSKCPLCLSAVDNEVHFCSVLSCIWWSKIRVYWTQIFQ